MSDDHFWAGVCLHPTRLSDDERDHADRHPGREHLSQLIARCSRPVDHDGVHLAEVITGKPQAPSLWLEWDRTVRRWRVDEFCPADSEDIPAYAVPCYLPAGHSDPHGFTFRPHRRPWPFPEETATERIDPGDTLEADW